MTAADLSEEWPPGVGGRGARPWITGNITDGVLHDGHVEAGLSLPADLSDAALTRLSGGISGQGLTVHWLRPMPPVEQVNAKLTLTGPDALAIAVSGGKLGAIAVQGGQIGLTGLAASDQFADIEVQAAGPVPDLLALLKHPRLKLLDRSPIKLNDASGQFAGKVGVTRLPLRDAITMDDVRLHANTKLTSLRIPALVAGDDLDNGSLTLDVDSDGLRAAGSAEVAGVPAQMQLDMDFRHGPPTQTTQTISASATLDARHLAALGVDARDYFSGPAALTLAMTVQRNGHGEAKLHGDLTQAALTLAPLAFAKPAGQAATLDARATLEGNALTGVNGLKLDGSGIRVEADASFAAGRPDRVQLHTLQLGPNNDAEGEVRLPVTPGDPYVATLTGRSIDASGQLGRSPGPPASAGPATTGPATAGPPYTVDARFDRVVLGPGRQVEAAVLRAENDGRILNTLRVNGRVGPGGAFALAIAPQGHGRALTGSAEDAGALLRAVDVLPTMQGGRLSLTGTFDDARADHALTGRAQIDEFRIHNAAILGKILQAMTLYGLVNVMEGSGLGFTKLEAPFRYAGQRLDLFDARAFSASLGMTAKGHADLGQQSIDMQGTIVPAYFFNSLLGNIPVLGRLFSPERGGGVFSATYAVRGPLDNPSISVNPLAALTPGALRGLFGLF